MRETYPVGVLATAQRVARALTARHSDLQGIRVVLARGAIQQEWRYLVHQGKAHNWRALRNSLNGYLTEHDGHHHACGTGWTKRTSRRRADKICKETP